MMGSIWKGWARYKRRPVRCSWIQLASAQIVWGGELTGEYANCRKLLCEAQSCSTRVLMPLVMLLLHTTTWHVIAWTSCAIHCDLRRPLHPMVMCAQSRLEFWRWLGVQWSEAQGVQVGAIGTDQWDQTGQGSPERGRWGDSDWAYVEATGWDLAMEQIVTAWFFVHLPGRRFLPCPCPWGISLKACSICV